jgi:transcriptional regulator NrdR family protein
MDKAGMLCPKCHDESATAVSTSRGGAKEYRTVERHVCAGCSTRIDALGHGKAKTETVIHTCAYAPDKGVACCK